MKVEQARLHDARIAVCALMDAMLPSEQDAYPLFPERTFTLEPSDVGHFIDSSDGLERVELIVEKLPMYGETRREMLRRAIRRQPKPKTQLHLVINAFHADGRISAVFFPQSEVLRKRVDTYGVQRTIETSAVSSLTMDDLNALQSLLKKVSST